MSPNDSDSVLLILSAPTGGGKTTVAHRVIKTDGKIRFAVSHTTRTQRPGEKNGIDYHFVSEDDFKAMVSAGQFLEWANVHGHLYGTHSSELKTAHEEGNDLLLDIDVQGGLQVREKMIDSVLVFLLPPSLKTLLERIEGRAREADFNLPKRMATAARELEIAKEYDYNVRNWDLDDTVAAVRKILDVSRLRSGKCGELRAQLDMEIKCWLRSNNVQGR